MVYERGVDACVGGDVAAHRSLRGNPPRRSGFAQPRESPPAYCSALGRRPARAIGGPFALTIHGSVTLIRRMVNSAIDCQELLVVRGGVEVLHSVSVSVPMGTVTGLLGPSGCGKTTLMRAVVGVRRLSRAVSVTVLGRPGRRSPAARPKSATAPRAPSVYLDLTVAREPALLRHRSWVRRPGGVDRGDSTQVDLSRFAGRLAARLSGGPAQSGSASRSRSLGRPGPARARRADRRTRPRAARSDLWALFNRTGRRGR